jgi:hypothetical protein
MNVTKSLTSNVTKIANTIKTGAINATTKLSNVGSAIKQKTNAVTNTVQKKVEEVTTTSGNVSKWTAMTQEFLNSNTAISKFVGFFLCLLLFIILFQFGMGIIQNLFGPSFNPYIINGMVPSDKLTQISTNPNDKKSIPVYRSINEDQGIEYSWNVWFFIDGASPKENARIFSKGSGENTNYNTSYVKDLNTQFVNVSPGLFLNKAPDGLSYNLNVIVNTFDSSVNELPLYEKVIIENIPVQKWVCFTMRVQGKIVDIYINGTLAKRVTLISVPKQNYYDTYIGDTNGFKGYISSLRYYAYAIGYSEIQALFAGGPSVKMITTDSMPASSDYLSINWYFT